MKLPESATMEQIKSNYRALLAEWHPDRSGKDQEKSNDMTRRIISAYKTISAYCEQYQYCFSEDEVKKYLSPHEWWLEHFGDDPLWGGGMKPE